MECGVKGGEGAKEGMTKGQEETFGVIGIFVVLNVIMVSQAYACVKIYYQIVHCMFRLSYIMYMSGKPLREKRKGTGD